MSIAHFLPIAIKFSVMMMVFALGLNATVRDALFFFRHPRLLFRALLSLNFIMLAVAVAIISILALPAPVKIAIIALAVSPVPPILPKRTIKAAGGEANGLGLLVAAALCAIVLVPASVSILARYFGADWHMPMENVALVVGMMILVPVIAGISVRHFAPAWAARFAHPVSLIATVLLAIAALPVLFIASRIMWAMVGNGLVLSLVLFALVGLAVGHVLGGPNADDRTLLALASSTRHPGMALAVAGLNFPNEKAVLAVLLCHLIIGTVIAIPYMSWRKRVRMGGRKPISIRT